MTRKWLLLRLLEDAGQKGVTTAEVMQAGVGSRYGARLLELRTDGYTIRSERERAGSFRYTLLSSLGVESGAGSGPPSRAVQAHISTPVCGAPASPALCSQPSLFVDEPRTSSHYEDAA